mgnify:CR=1 FL=1
MLKTFKATTIDQLPEEIIPRSVTSIFFGYTIWRKDVNTASAEAAHEIFRFVGLREAGECDKVAEVTETFEQLFALGMFMQVHNLDVIFTDLENTEE